MKRMRHLLSLGAGLALCSALCLSAGAESYDIGLGSVQIDFADGAQVVTYQSERHVDDNPVITGKSTQNTVAVYAPESQRLHVTIQDLDVDVSSLQEAPAFAVSGEGSLVLNLLGNSSLRSGLMHAGIEVKDAALYILGQDDGILNASGGQFGAGIGGGANGSGNRITIAGGNINAAGGVFGAGIGGGQFGAGSRISILGGQISVKGGMKAAGIGGGWCGSASDISLLGGRLNAFGVQAVGSGEGAQEAVRMDVIPVAGSMQVSTDSGALFTADVGERVVLDVKTQLLITEGFDADESFVPTAPAESLPPVEAEPEETKPEETKPIETKPEETKPVETKPEETKPAETKPEEPTSGKAVPASFQVRDAEGKSIPFSYEKTDAVVEITCEQDATDFSFSCEDIRALKDDGVIFVRLNFGGKKTRVTLQSVLKWLDAGTKEVFIRMPPASGPVLYKDGTSLWIY